MSNAVVHSSGSFCWIELATTDQPAAKVFYESLFGWKPEDTPMGPSESYTIFKLQGRDAAAAYTMRPDDRAKGVPPHWMVYVLVESADDSAAKAASLGGTVLAPPFDVMEHGRMAVIQDPTGAIFSLWQRKQYQGYLISGVDGSLCWCDLSSPDPERASRFYSELFGWRISAGDKDASGYLHIMNGETPIGGVQPGSQRNPNAPPHWLIYFLTSGCDKFASRAKEMGANLLVPPMTIEEVGRMSVVADPQGAVFALFQGFGKH